MYSLTMVFLWSLLLAMNGNVGNVTLAKNKKPNITTSYQAEANSDQSVPTLLSLIQL